MMNSKESQISTIDKKKEKNAPFGITLRSVQMTKGEQCVKNVGNQKVCDLHCPNIRLLLI